MFTEFQREQLARITLICPSYNRQDAVCSKIEFFSSIRFVRLIIIDGSPGNAAVSEVAADNISYIHMPNAGLSERLQLAFSLIKTDYCSLMGDDELLDLYGLATLATYLDKNQDVVSAAGKCISFTGISDGSLIHEEEYTENFVIDDGAGSGRFSRVVNSTYLYGSKSLYALVRSDVWISAMVVALTLDGYARYLPELVWEVVVASYGRRVSLNLPFWYRNRSVGPVREQNGAPQDFGCDELSICEFSTDRKHHELYREFKGNFLAALKDQRLDGVLSRFRFINYFAVDFICRNYCRSVFSDKKYSRARNLIDLLIVRVILGTDAFVKFKIRKDLLIDKNMKRAQVMDALCSTFAAFPLKYKASIKQELQKLVALEEFH